MTIGGTFLEAQGAIERPGSLHIGQGIKTHALIPPGFCLLDNRQRKGAAQSLSLEFRDYVQTFHLADSWLELAQAHAPRHTAVTFRDQHTSAGWCVLTRESGHFLCEGLEFEIDAQRAGVFFDQRTDSTVIRGTGLVYSGVQFVLLVL